MTKILRSCFFAITLLVCANTLRAETASPVQLADGDRVVLLGDTFFERAQRYGWLETALQLRFPKGNIHFRNLGWSGDTVFAESRGIFDPPAKGYGRMLEQVRGLKPTVILLNYGGNEAFNGPGYIDTFTKQYDRLLDDLSSTDARMVLVSPLPLLNAGPPLPDPTRHNRIRKQFVGAVQQLARDRGLHFVDLWSPLESHLDDFSTKAVTEEGVHLTGYGYSIVSTIFARVLAGDPVSDAPTVAIQSDGAVISGKQIRQDNYTADNTSRTLQATQAAETPTTGIRVSAGSLKPGMYELRSNNVLLGLLTAEQLANSALSEFGGVSVLDVEELRQTIVEKNEMYFHRWRPQNVTYLFLFRKHEQGNNAKEVDEFLPIIARLEKRIAELKNQPRKIAIEITRKTESTN